MSPRLRELLIRLCISEGFHNALDDQSAFDRRCVHPLFLGVEHLERLDAGLLPEDGKTLEMAVRNN